MKKIFITFTLLITLYTVSFGRRVMTWVPLYAIDNCKSLTNDATKSQWFKNGLTHLGLQFWVPGDNGAVTFFTDYQFTYKAATMAQDVNYFVNWGNQNQVKVMLCLFNMHNDDFDWTYAKNVIDNYPTQTATNIMSIVNTYGLDGVDIDFEGVGNYGGDKTAFVSFLNILGQQLHAAGKELSVNMFPTPCYNYPNPSWESAMAPYVDYMNIMGYDNTYEHNNSVFGYCPGDPAEVGAYVYRYSYIENYLTVKQEVASSMLNYGIPSWTGDSWGEQCAHENILDIAEVSDAGGIAIWDMQLTGGGFWRNPVTWDLIAMFKNDSTAAQIRSQLPICGVTTFVNKKKMDSPVFYDSFHKTVNLSGNEGELYLYSSVGVLEKKWNVNAGENVSLEGTGDGFYIVKFETSSGLFSEAICVFK